jgi:hypothetical protein
MTTTEKKKKKKMVMMVLRTKTCGVMKYLTVRLKRRRIVCPDLQHRSK